MTDNKRVILVADDEPINRELLAYIFQEHYIVVTTVDGAETIKAVEDNENNLALIILDLVLPDISGLDVLEKLKVKGILEKVPVIMLTGESTEESDEKAYLYGVSDIIYKPFLPNSLMRRANNIIELFDHRNELERKLNKRTAELVDAQERLRKNNEFLVNALSSVVEFRNPLTGEHTYRVKAFTKVLLKYLMEYYPEYGITKEDAANIVNASALHDIGKIAIPDGILLKPYKLSDDEYNLIKMHTVLGCELLEKFKHEDNDKFYDICYDICRYHHERYDGTGYPDGLKGDAIPIWAQVVALADVFDTLVSKRVYKASYSVEEAVEMIKDGECGVFSPVLNDCFDRAKNELIEVIEKGF
ncbi:MAG: response regulator [Lachnospiraceae bacterium]|nr:response regulator [Lachnospiraceae bacterium]